MGAQSRTWARLLTLLQKDSCCSDRFATMTTVMDENRIFCAEQINVPAELPDIIKEFTKSAIREDPSAKCMDAAQSKMLIYQWAADYFKEKASAKKMEADA